MYGSADPILNCLSLYLQIDYGGLNRVGRPAEVVTQIL